MAKKTETPEAAAPVPGPQPSIGRVVHYVLPDGPNIAAHRPAIITDVREDGTVDLQVFSTGDGTGVGDALPGVFRQAAVPHDDSHQTGTWHWPERV